MKLTTWALIFVWYVHPFARDLPMKKVLQPILVLHAFRYLGLMFLVPGVTTEPLDSRFADPAAYGDLIAAILALGALAISTMRPGVSLLTTRRKPKTKSFSKEYAG